MSLESAAKYAAEHPFKTIAGIAAAGGAIALFPHLAPPLAAKVGLSAKTAMSIGSSSLLAGPVAVGAAQIFH